MSKPSESLLGPVGREPLSVLVAGRIRDAIVAGELADGAPLPGEKTLGERFGVGRSTVREALRILQAQGLVSGGDRVSTRAPIVNGAGAVSSAAFALENVLRLGQVPLPDLVGMRLLIETAAIAEAAPKLDAATRGRAEDAIAEMEAAGDDVERFIDADVAFHAALIDAAGNAAYVLVNNVLRGTMAGHLRAALEREPERAAVMQRLNGEHRAILEAAAAGDGALAARRMGAHIRDFYEARVEP
jgi:DNA-binding FadR family transcriptional regulator